MFGIDDAIAGIGAVAGLFGGGGSESSGVPDYVKIRRKAEKAGFNPAFALSQGGFSAPVSGPSFGDRIATAANAIGDHLGQKEQLKLQQTELQQRERELEQREKQLNKLPSRTILPTAPPMGPKKGDGLDAHRANVQPGAATAAAADEAETGIDLQDPDRAAAFRAFGIDFQGSGAFNTADRYSQEGGEPMEWASAPFVIVDAIANTAMTGIENAGNKGKMARIYRDVKKAEAEKEEWKDKSGREYRDPHYPMRAPRRPSYQMPFQ